MLSGRRRRCSSSSLAAATLAGVLTLLPSIGHAQSTSDDLARRHFDSGVAYLEESDYESALKAFQKAYDLSKRPEILLNVATVHERQSDLPAAVSALKGYLEASPQGEHAETVKLRIQNLEKRSQEQEVPKTAPDPAPAPTPPAPAPPTTAPAVAAPQPTPPPHATEPNRLPAFISLGVGGLMAGGSLVTGLIAKSKYDDAESTCGHACSDDQLASSRTFALTSTVLTAAAVLGVGLGVGLLLTSEGESDLARAQPRLDVALGLGGGAASARWRF